MYSVAKRYAASENEAEDIMQDAVERLLKRIPKLMELPGCTLPTYLVYTVRSTAVNFKRHQNVIEKHTLPIDYDDGNTYEEPSESPQEILEREEQQRQFAAIWDQIPRADAELLYRKYILQESDEKLAEIYHCKKGEYPDETDPRKTQGHFPDERRRPFMTRREKLEEQYEDAYFALLMDAVAEKEGARLEELNDQLNRDPTAAVPEEIDRRCRKVINRHFAEQRRSGYWRMTKRVLNRAAIVAAVMMLLFTSAFALSEDFRISALNLFDYCGRTVHTIGNEKR